MKFRNFSVNLNSKCNFDCDYCFIPEKSGGEISYTTLTKFRRFTQEYGTRKLSVDIFGAEPFLSWDKMTHLINMGSVFHWKMGVTTNASLITPNRAQFLAKNKVGVLVSYDGSRRSHNRFRKFKGGQGSWRKVCEGIQCLRDAGVSYGCAMVVSPENLPYLVHNVKSAAARGFQYIALNPQFQVGLKPHPTGYDWELLRQKYRGAAEWALKHGVALKFTLDALHTYASKDRKSSTSATCGACKGSIAVDWDGSVYICHRACGLEEFRIGDIETGPIPELVKSYRMRDINECHQCVLFHQRGSCGHCWTMAKALTGDMMKVPESLCLFQNIIHDVDLDLFADLTIINDSQMTSKT